MRLEVSGRETPSGFCLLVKDGIKTGRYFLKYPRPIWQAVPRRLRQSLIDELAFVLTGHLPFQRKEISEIKYSGSRPKSFYSYLANLLLTIPFDAFMGGRKSWDLYRLLLNANFTFAPLPQSGFEKEADSGLNHRKAVIPFTFGKDSLLTFALARELGIRNRLVFIEEPRELYAAAHKKELLGKFQKEFNQKVDFLPNPAGILRDVSEGTGWFGWELLLTSFVLLLLPYARYDKAKYLLLANEASCNEMTRNGEDINFYPSFEQTDNWTLEETAIVQKVSRLPLAVSSFIGAIHDLAVIKILHQRYPDVAKYQMSCFADRPDAKLKRWCSSCSKCARTYIFLLANGIDPREVGFTDDLLSAKYQNLYALFENGSAGKEGYDATSVGRDEQLLAFQLAAQRDIAGELITLFRKKHGDEALKKKDFLMKKYFSLHSSATIPKEYRHKVYSIFRKELSR